MEIGLTTEPADAAEIGLSVLRSPKGSEETRIVYEHAAGELWVDRGRASLDPGPSQERRGAAVRLEPGGTLGLRE